MSQGANVVTFLLRHSSDSNRLCPFILQSEPGEPFFPPGFVLSSPPHYLFFSFRMFCFLTMNYSLLVHDNSLLYYFGPSRFFKCGFHRFRTHSEGVSLYAPV